MTLQVRGVLSALLSKLGSRRLDSHAFGSVFFGLQRMQCRHAEVRDVLSALSAALPPAPSSAGLDRRADRGMREEEEHFLATSYAMAFSGLRLMQDDTKEVAELLAKIHTLMLSCPQDFATASLVNILFGLQNMTAGSGDEVRNILSFVSAQFARKHMSASSPGEGEVDSVSASGLRAGGKRVAPDSLLQYNALTPSRLGRALLGLQRMSSDLAEVRGVVSALAAALEQQQGLRGRDSRGEEADTDTDTDASSCFSALDLRRVVGGLRGLSSDHREVRRLLTALASEVLRQGQRQGQRPRRRPRRGGTLPLGAETIGKKYEYQFGVLTLSLFLLSYLTACGLCR